jgi:uncharacterized Fe-S cluster protein YjdI/CDGSH-type Zn-finger protein
MAGQDQRGRAYTAPGITVFFDARRCLHFAECVRGLSTVFDVEKRPWIQPDQARPEQVADVVRRCPSGALHYELHGGQPEVAQSPTRVRAAADGPLVLRGDLRIQTPDGELTELRAALCRCGRTGNQPFCDHECERTGWSSASVPRSD